MTDTDRSTRPALTRQRLTVPVRIFLSLGWPAETIVLLSFELFILFYYTQVLGLSGALTGAALFLAMCVDGISDPILGTFSDNLRNSPWGRRHTLMFLAPIPLALFFVLVFVPPVGLRGWGLFVWLTATAVGARVACALFVIPYSTQIAEMTRAAETRVSLSIYQSVAQTSVQFLLLWASFSVFFAASPHFANGQEDRGAYAPFAVTWSVILAVLTSLSAAGTYRYMRRLEISTPLAAARRMSFRAFLASWKSILGGNPNVRVVFFGAIAMVIASGMARALTSHMGIYFWRLTPKQISEWQQAAIPGTFAGMFIARYLVKRVNSKPIIIIGMSMMYLSYVVPPGLRLLGWIPANGDPFIYYMLVGGNLFMGVGLGFVIMLSALMSAETADEEELLMGAPQQGLLYGFIFLATKIGSGCGKLFSGVTLDMIHFPVDHGARKIEQHVIDQLAMTLIGCVLLLGSLSLLIWSRYSITRTRHLEITQRLGERNPEIAALEAA